MDTKPFNKVLIYDDDCPLCKAYSSAFVRTGFLRPGNRITFSEIERCEKGMAGCANLDRRRAKHEIPLVDVDSGSVIYGVDALVEILSQKTSFIKNVMRLKMVDAVMRKLYQFVSYNRRIIVAGISVHKGVWDCAPDYSHHWRLMLVFATGFFSAMFNLTSLLVVKQNSSVYWLTLMHTLLYVIPLLLALQTRKTQAVDILAHAGIVLTLTSFLVLCFVLLQTIFQLHAMWGIVAFVIVSTTLVAQAKRRMRFYNTTSFPET